MKIITVLLLLVVLMASITIIRRYSVDGGYTEWSPWSPCSFTCGAGVQVRTRECTNPLPRGLGKVCSKIGGSINRRKCYLKSCPIDGSWSSWGEWGKCITKCEEGKQFRIRNCTGQLYGGKFCTDEKNNKKERKCVIPVPCPINGNWGSWNDWSKCSTSCGDGIIQRKRICNNPEPKNSGNQCPGTHHEIKACNLKECADVANKNTTAKV